jgi:hypothetical protein
LVVVVTLMEDFTFVEESSQYQEIDDRHCMQSTPSTECKVVKS